MFSFHNLLVCCKINEHTRVLVKVLGQILFTKSDTKTSDFTKLIILVILLPMICCSVLYLDLQKKVLT